jgi:hypothetical protein
MPVINTQYDFYYGEPGKCSVCASPLHFPFLLWEGANPLRICEGCCQEMKDGFVADLIQMNATIWKCAVSTSATPLACAWSAVTPGALKRRDAGSRRHGRPQPRRARFRRVVLALASQAGAKARSKRRAARPDAGRAAAVDAPERPQDASRPDLGPG